MGSEAAVRSLFRRDLAAADDPAERKRELIAEYEELFASPYQAAVARLHRRRHRAGRDPQPPDSRPGNVRDQAGQRAASKAR